MEKATRHDAVGSLNCSGCSGLQSEAETVRTSVVGTSSTSHDPCRPKHNYTYLLILAGRSTGMCARVGGGGRKHIAVCRASRARTGYVATHIQSSHTTRDM